MVLQFDELEGCYTLDINGDFENFIREMRLKLGVHVESNDPRFVDVLYIKKEKTLTYVIIKLKEEERYIRVLIRVKDLYTLAIDPATALNLENWIILQGDDDIEGTKAYLNIRKIEAEKRKVFLDHRPSKCGSTSYNGRKSQLGKPALSDIIGALGKPDLDAPRHEESFEKSLNTLFRSISEALRFHSVCHYIVEKYDERCYPSPEILTDINNWRTYGKCVQKWINGITKCKSGDEKLAKAQAKELKSAVEKIAMMVKYDKAYLKTEDNSNKNVETSGKGN